MPTASTESVASADNRDVPQDSTNSGFRVSLIAGHNIWEWLFLLVATWNVATLLAGSGVALAQCKLFPSIINHEFMIEIIGVSTTVIALALALYGVHNEHQYDMYLHIVFIAIADILSVLAAFKQCHFSFKIICSIFGILLTVLNIVFAHKATSAPDWTEFRIIGASETVSEMYKKQCRFLSLLKFDSLFVVICALFSFPITLEFPNIRNLYLLLVLVTIFSFMSWCCGKVMISREDKYLAAGFVVLCITYPCLIIYQMHMSRLYKSSSSEKPVFYLSAQYVGIIIVACKFILLVMTTRTCRTFGYGLNSRSLELLKCFLERPSAIPTPMEKHLLVQFLKDLCKLKSPKPLEDRKFSYSDIYRF